MLPKIFRDLAAFQGLLWILAAGAFAGEATKSRPPENLFANASFEDGRDLWQMDRAGKTTATFLVDDKDAAAGRRKARCCTSSPPTTGESSSARPWRPRPPARPTPLPCWPRACRNR